MNLDSAADVSHVFVYGTLKRGMGRASMWPHEPLEVRIAWVAGRLFDVGPYPAMIEGRHWIEGELWKLRPEHVKNTLVVLDQIEGYRGGEDDLYGRVIVTCALENPIAATAKAPIATARAYTYHYRAELPEGAELAPHEDGLLRWPPR